MNEELSKLVSDAMDNYRHAVTWLGHAEGELLAVSPDILEVIHGKYLPQLERVDLAARELEIAINKALDAKPDMLPASTTASEESLKEVAPVEETEASTEAPAQEMVEKPKKSRAKKASATPVEAEDAPEVPAIDPEVKAKSDAAWAEHDKTEGYKPVDIKKKVAPIAKTEAPADDSTDFEGAEDPENPEVDGDIDPELLDASDEELKTLCNTLCRQHAGKFNVPTTQGVMKRIGGHPRFSLFSREDLLRLIVQLEKEIA